MEQQDGIRAFRFLVHAEVEAYLEDFCLEVVDTCLSNWLVDLKARTAPMSLLAFAEGAVKKPPDARGPGRSAVLVTIEEAKRRYGVVVESNNGIREKNLLRLLLPVGVRESQLRAAFVGTMDSYGTKRGQVAHKSFAVQRVLDRGDAIHETAVILRGLRGLDVLLRQLRDE